MTYSHIFVDGQQDSISQGTNQKYTWLNIANSFAKMCMMDDCFNSHLGNIPQRLWEQRCNDGNAEWESHCADGRSDHELGNGHLLLIKAPAVGASLAAGNVVAGFQPLVLVIGGHAKWVQAWLWLGCDWKKSQKWRSAHMQQHLSVSGLRKFISSLHCTGSSHELECLSVGLYHKV